VSPIIRYRIGDRGEFVDCPCGRGGPALRLLGREGELIKFAGTLVSPQDLADTARTAAGVRAAQVALITAPGTEAIEVRVVPDPAARPDPAGIRRQLIDSHIDLGFGLRGEDDAFQVRVVDVLPTNPRTGKTPALIREQRT
jgi:phenylacetate-CoA ligase